MGVPFFLQYSNLWYWTPRIFCVFWSNVVDISPPWFSFSEAKTIRQKSAFFHLFRFSKPVLMEIVAQTGEESKRSVAKSKNSATLQRWNQLLLTEARTTFWTACNFLPWWNWKGSWNAATCKDGCPFHISPATAGNLLRAPVPRPRTDKVRKPLLLRSDVPFSFPFFLIFVLRPVENTVRCLIDFPQPANYS